MIRVAQKRGVFFIILGSSSSSSTIHAHLVKQAPFRCQKFWTRLDVIQIPSFFTLSVTSIFNRLYRVLNIDKKITNYTV
jgi:hypothetical protein